MENDQLYQQIQNLKSQMHNQFDDGHQSIEIDMDHLLKQKEKAEKSAEYVIKNIVTPAMDIVHHEFENVEIKKSNKHSIECEFLHTKKMPASGKIVFTYCVDQHYVEPTLEFFAQLHPVFITVDKNDQLNLAKVLHDANETTYSAQSVQIQIRAWINTKITAFLEKYIAVEYHPIYQKGNFVVDPVCGMRFVKARAKVVAKDIEKKLEIYFCSHNCYDRWQVMNGQHK